MPLLPLGCLGRKLQLDFILDPVPSRDRDLVRP
jgi:hypothetical protein